MPERPCGTIWQCGEESFLEMDHRVKPGDDGRENAVSAFKSLHAGTAAQVCLDQQLAAAAEA